MLAGLKSYPFLGHPNTPAHLSIMVHKIFQHSPADYLFGQNVSWLANYGTKGGGERAHHSLSVSPSRLRPVGDSGQWGIVLKFFQTYWRYIVYRISRSSRQHLFFERILLTSINKQQNGFSCPRIRFIPTHLAVCSKMKVFILEGRWLNGRRNSNLKYASEHIE